MNKKKYINLSILIFLIFIVVFIYTNSKFDVRQLKGYILTGDENDIEKAVIIDLTRNEKIHFDYLGVTGGISFAGNETQLILRLDKNIYLYNPITKNKTLLCELDFRDFDYIKYINDSYISFVENGKLVLYNIKSQKSEILAEDIAGGDYSYSYDTLKFYYSDEHNIIYELKLGTKEKKYITAGYRPRVSKNGKIIAYQKKESGIVYIETRDISSGKTWRKSSTPINYLLSPDGNYLLMVKDCNPNSFAILYVYFSAIIDSIFGANLGGYIGKELVIYDYRNRTELTLIEKYSRLNFTCLDWV